uniref:Pre-mRNA-splicing factor ISY n=1 Tax=Ananas comosus var. bracteatus TaxID=296719 RepID=A0A6V7NVC6_ANACO|nr:unnamed protein product [Ananas comosus var. bracteatus]
MARNEEKAQSMLNRFIAMKQEEERKRKKAKARRPYLASECGDLTEADRWRSEILREIGAKVAEIQNEGLGEHRLRDLNDEINRLLRERAHWERRIVELGGPSYAGGASLEGDTVDVPNPSGRGPGYRHLGAAKRLPGVLELFEKARRPKSPARSTTPTGASTRATTAPATTTSGKGMRRMRRGGRRARRGVCGAGDAARRERDREDDCGEEEGGGAAEQVHQRRAPGAAGRRQGHAQRPPLEF